MSDSWVAWAKTVQKISPTAKLVLCELARLSDSRGVSITSTEHLVQTTARCPRSVYYALDALEDEGLLGREKRRNGNRQAASRIELYRPLPTNQINTTNIKHSPISMHQSGLEIDDLALQANETEGLRFIIDQAIKDEWQGQPVAIIAATISKWGSRQFHSAIKKSMIYAGMSWDEAVTDTFSIAWEQIRTNAEKLTQAINPWGLWTTMVSRASSGAKNSKKKSQIDLVDPTFFPETGNRPGSGDSEYHQVSVDDFSGPLDQFIRALICEGVPETIAWASMGRIAELAANSPVDARQTRAALDPRLADLGFDAQTSRDLMTAVVGSRRGSKNGIHNLDAENMRLVSKTISQQYAAVSQFTY